MTYKTTIIFGEAAARVYGGDDERSREVLREYGGVQDFEFETEAELLAFRMGLEEACGWMDFAEVDPSDPLTD